MIDTARLRRLLLASALLLAPTGAMAETQHLPTPQPARAVAAPEPAHPALWKLQKGASTIYLFGTIHALPHDLDWFSGPVEQAFGASDTLVTEII